MRAKIAALAVVGLLVVPAAAAGAKRSGDISGGGRLEITVNNRGGGNVSVGTIRIKRIIVNCEGTDHELSFSIRGGTPVNTKRRFRIRAQDNSGGNSRVSGRFNRSFKRIEGKIRVFGKFATQGGGTVRCNSGRERYVAK